MAADEHAAELDELHDLLTAARLRAVDQIAALQDGFDSIVASTQFGATDDEHDPEGITIGFERGQLGAVLDAARRQLAEVDEALVRLAAGDHGRCERCGDPIAHGRLLARPATRRCIGCADL